MRKVYPRKKQFFTKKLLKNNYVVSLDEEGPFYHWPRLFIENRLTLKLLIIAILSIFSYGETMKKIFQKMS